MSDYLSEHDPRELALLAAFLTHVKVACIGLGIQLCCVLFGLVSIGFVVFILMHLPALILNLVMIVISILRLLWFRLKCPKGRGISGWKVALVPILHVVASIGLLWWSFLLAVASAPDL